MAAHPGQGELIARCQAAGLRFTREGEHFVIFIEAPEEVVIVEFLHSRSDLPSRIAALEVMGGR